MLALVIAASVVASPFVDQESSVKSVYLWDKKTIKVRSFDVGLSTDVERLRRSKAELLIVRVVSSGTNLSALYGKLKKGPGGNRRALLVEFPALSVRKDNGLLWQGKWDANSDGKPDLDAPNWLQARNEDGDYPLDSSDAKLREQLIALSKRVSKAGFDGYVFNTGNEEKTDKSGFDAKLIYDVTFQARVQKGGFLSFVRNPGWLNKFPGVRAFVDGYVIDGLFYGKDKLNVKSDEEFLEETEEELEQVEELKRIVMAIAYTNVPAQVKDNQRRAREKGYLSLALSKRF